MSPPDAARPSHYPLAPSVESISQLVHGFYGDVRRDPLLGPVFEQALHGQWDTHLQRLVDADPRAAREALEMSQEQAPELYLIAQNQPPSQWAQSLMSSESMHSLMSRSPSQAKALLDQPDLRSLLELLP